MRRHEAPMEQRPAGPERIPIGEELQEGCSGSHADKGEEYNQRLISTIILERAIVLGIVPAAEIDAIQDCEYSHQIEFEGMLTN